MRQSLTSQFQTALLKAYRYNYRVLIESDLMWYNLSSRERIRPVFTFLKSWMPIFNPKKKIILIIIYKNSQVTTYNQDLRILEFHFLNFVHSVASISQLILINFVDSVEKRDLIELVNNYFFIILFYYFFLNFYILHY